jgi:Rieske Fe-S protein
MSASSLAISLASCKAARYVSGTLNQDGVLVDLAEFRKTSGEKASYRSYIIVRNEALQYPICVYRFSDHEYSALWMQCTHQGAELQVSGDYLQCPAHGSEFNKKGTVTNGPANSNLRMFPVTINGNELFIDLRKQ